MIGLILAGGFARRLWPLTKDTPKPLLEVAGKPILEHIIRKLENLDLERIYVSTNARFGPVFEEWLQGFKSDKEIRLIIEPPVEEGQKFGSIGGLKYFMDMENVRDDLLILAGDNLFDDDLSDILIGDKTNPFVCLFDVKSMDQARRLGTVELDKNMRIIDFHEKAEKPKTTLAATCMYFFPADVRKDVDTYLSGKNNPDAPGFFIEWLSHKRDVKGHILKKKWFDIGSLEAYEQAKKEYEE